MFQTVYKGLFSGIISVRLGRQSSPGSRSSSGIARSLPSILRSSAGYPIIGIVRGVRFSSADSQKLKGSVKPKEKTKNSKQKTSSRGWKKLSQAELRTHLEAFFAQPEYAGFKYNPAKPYMEEFYRMTKQFGWNSRGTEEQQKKFQGAREGINRASVLQFNAIFGKNTKDPAAWRNLCSVLDIAKIPKSRYGCRELVKSLYINICDLVDSPVLKTKVRHYDSEEELSAYTKRTGKFFPLEDAHAGGMLRFLLRHILHPPAGESPYPRPELRK